MEYNHQNGIVNIYSHELSAYAFKKPINPTSSVPNGGFIKVPVFPVSGLDFIEYPNYECLSYKDDLTLRLSATPYRVVFVSGMFTLEMLRSVKHLPMSFIPSYNFEFLAEAIVCAYVFCMADSIKEIRVRLTFNRNDTSDSVSFEREYDSSTLSVLTDTLLDRMIPFIKVFRQKKELLSSEIKNLAFPYSDIREGQHELMLGVMKTLRQGGKLVASAPTGTGKTMATLYPSIKALGAGLVDRIFYLTGKGVTGKAAYDAVKLLNNSVPHIRCINVRAKMNVCPNPGKYDDCYVCPHTNDNITDGKFLSYKQRSNAALAELLENDTVYDSKVIAECAERHYVCPYELTLDLSEFCEVIICDYNYVFDFSVRFRRYFDTDRGEKYVFLIDEAHNLPDRVRTMYSSEFSPAQIEEYAELLSENMIKDTEVGQAVNQCREAFAEIKELCLDNVTYFTDKKGDHKTGFYKSDIVPVNLISAASSIVSLCRSRERRCGDVKHIYDGLYNLASSLINSAKFSEKGFSFLAELYDDRLICRNFCLDPSDIITLMTSMSHATVFFSATLSPVEYFSDMFGCSDSPALKAESPFDPNNMNVTIFDGISTRYADRSDTAEEIAEVISAVLNAKDGHYFVFFPSYRYMRTVCKELLKICPDIKAVMQKQDMTFADREKFLLAFKSKKFKSIVGFCVLGGVFSEGVDLTGDSLIGTIIVGAGLPGISSELNLMSEYYENKFGSGHLYAYDYPAINRIEQAAGRVIRTADDKGVVVLIDDRLSSPEIASRFPDFWPKIACTSDNNTLSMILERFWDRHDSFSE